MTRWNYCNDSWVSCRCYNCSCPYFTNTHTEAHTVKHTWHQLCLRLLNAYKHTKRRLIWVKWAVLLIRLFVVVVLRSVSSWYAPSLLSLQSIPTPTLLISYLLKITADICLTLTARGSFSIAATTPLTATYKPRCHYQPCLSVVLLVVVV